MTNAKRTKLEDGMVAREKSGQEDEHGSQEPAVSENTEPILPDADHAVFGRAMRLLELAQKSTIVMS